MQYHNENSKSDDELDRVVDAVLASYAAEPRLGLDGRVMANLRTVETRDADRIWRHWSIAMALAAVFIIAAALAWRWTAHTNRPIAKQPSSPTVPASTEATHRERDPHATNLQAVRRKLRRPTQNETVAANPKLEIFPSPLPLSEQEQILATYVAQYPEHAALLAEARMDALKQDADAQREVIERDEKQ